MNFDVFSRSKYRANDKSGDDVALVLPGVCFGVLDGATDAEGRDLNGVPMAELPHWWLPKSWLKSSYHIETEKKMRKHCWQISAGLMRGHLGTTTLISLQLPLWLWP